MARHFFGGPPPVRPATDHDILMLIRDTLAPWFDHGEGRADDIIEQIGQIMKAAGWLIEPDARGSHAHSSLP